MTSLKLPGYISELSMKQNCILPKQYGQITKQIYDVQNMPEAWMNSDKKRYGKGVQLFISDTRRIEKHILPVGWTLRLSDLSAFMEILAWK